MDVISKLRVKFIVTIAFILTLVFSGLFFVINIMSTKTTENQVEGRLRELAANDGVFFSPNMQYRFKDAMSGIPLSDRYGDSDRNPPDAPDGYDGNRDDNLLRYKKDRFMFFSFSQPFDISSMRNYFSVKLDKDGKIKDIVSPFPLHFTSEEISELVSSLTLTDDEFGFLGGMGYLINKKNYGHIIVFAEVQAEANLHATVFKISMYLYFISLLISVVIAWFFSKWAVKPVRVAFDKQKSFVADASHELKTPLSVISANLDVLSAETGENKWISYIRSEVKRMSKLVKDLLYLAKCDSQDVKYQFCSFDLSRAIMSAVLPFESTVFEQEKVLETDIAENIQYTGDENAIKQIAVIFLDNAVKHTEEGAVIKVSLSASGSKTVFSVRNTGAGISPKDQKRIFERFYRTDKSRARDTGGYGLGLSIAKSIADIHHAKLVVNSVEGEYAEFSLIL